MSNLQIKGVRVHTVVDCHCMRWRKMVTAELSALWVLNKNSRDPGASSWYQSWYLDILMILIRCTQIIIKPLTKFVFLLCRPNFRSLVFTLPFFCSRVPRPHLREKIITKKSIINIYIWVRSYYVLKKLELIALRPSESQNYR